MSKKYKIKTIKDVLSCVNKDNIDNFMIDFRNFIEMAIDMQKLINTIGELQDIPKEKCRGDHEFTWIDDGKHKLEIRIDTKQK